ncbi:radical SAM superfamily enzyme, partial [Exiguobacterium sp. PvP048]
SDLDFKRLRIFDHKKHPIKVGFLCPTFMGQFSDGEGVFCL